MTISGLPLAIKFTPSHHIIIVQQTPPPVLCLLVALTTTTHPHNNTPNTTSSPFLSVAVIPVERIGCTDFCVTRNSATSSSTHHLYSRPRYLYPYQTPWIPHIMIL